MKKFFRLYVVLLLCVLFPAFSFAENAALTICTQNLHNYGLKTEPAQTSQLIYRFIEARCDVIAAQEIYGTNRKERVKHLKALAKELSKAREMSFQSFVGDSNDPRIANGFIVNEAAVILPKVESHTYEALPKLSVLGPTQHSHRGFIVLSFFKEEGGKKVTFHIVNIHFKSKVNGWKDGTQTNFEAFRMQEAEAVRVLAEKLGAGSEVVAVILGDRNTEPSGAASSILAGTRTLSDFIDGNCKVNAGLEAECGMPVRKEVFTPVVERKAGELGKELGSYRYKGKLSLIDEIYFERDAIDFVGDAGVIGTFGKGSDHKLGFVRVQN